MTTGDTRPAAVLFDMDGLLLDTERLFMQSFVELAQGLGIAAQTAETFYATLVGSSAQYTAQRLREFLPEDVDSVVFDADWGALHREKVQKGVPLKAHVVEVLQSIQRMDLPMAVVTSTFSEAAKHHLEHAGLLRFFETVCAGDEVSKNKPEPEPYLTGAARLGVQAARCIAFEDSDLGTTAAVRAGCVTVQVPDVRPKDMPLPDLGQIVARDLRHGAVQVGLFEEAVNRSLT